MSDDKSDLIERLEVAARYGTHFSNPFKIDMRDAIAEIKRLRVVERNYNRVAATTLSAVEGCECAICTGELALEDIDHHQLVASEAKAVADAAELRAQRDVLAKAFQAEVFGAGTYSIAEAKECGDAVKAWVESQKGPANAD